MSAVTRTTPPAPGRRSVVLLGLGAAAGVLTGCSLNNPYNSDRTPAAEAVRDLAPDVGVAVAAVALISTAQQELDVLVAERGADGAALAGLSSAYRAYADALRGAVPEGVEIPDSAAPRTPGPTPATPATPAPTTAGGSPEQAARHTAATVRARLNDFAMQAESGPFARLLGTMAAGLSQQLAVHRR